MNPINSSNISTPADQLPNPFSEIENLYRTTPNGLCLLDRNLCYVRLNDRLAAFTGKPVEDQIGRNICDVNPELADQVEPICRKVLETGQPVHEAEIEKKFSALQDPYRFLRISCCPIKDDNGLVSGVTMIVQNITQAKLSQQLIEERLCFETLLSELSAKFINLPADKIDKEIKSSMKQLMDFFDVDRISFGELSEDGKQWQSTHSISKPGIESFPPIIIEDLLPWYSGELRMGNVVHMERPSDLPAEAMREKEFCEKAGIKSVLCIPLSVGGSIICDLSLDSFHSHRVWPRELIPRLRLLGEIFANSLARRKSDESLQKAFYEIRNLKKQIEAEWSYLQEEIKLEHNFEEIIGQSKELQYVLFKVEQIAPTDTTVLILGETGTGKELVARAIHHLSPRKRRPMVKVNCATLPSNLIESELFGHEKGAFSGAHTRKMGRFELANGTTIFLDEIGELPLELQPKLLRVIQEGEFERLGSSHTMRTDVRIIAATNRKLEEEVKNGRFREDLWYRLNVFPITVPPLRQRQEDIALLVRFFVQKIGKKLGKEIKRIPAGTLRALENYSWPGNVRELENVIERAVINSQSTVLKLAENLKRSQAQSLAKDQRKPLDELERDYIIEILEETKGRIYGLKGAAKILGINPETLRYRIRKLGIKPHRYRS